MARLVRRSDDSEKLQGAITCPVIIPALELHRQFSGFASHPLSTKGGWGLAPSRLFVHRCPIGISFCQPASQSPRRILENSVDAYAMQLTRDLPGYTITNKIREGVLLTRGSGTLLPCVDHVYDRARLRRYQSTNLRPILASEMWIKSCRVPSVPTSHSISWTLLSVTGTRRGGYLHLAAHNPSR